MPVSAIHHVMMSALTRYITAPWMWPRESDLIVDLVSDLRGVLPPVHVGSSLNLAPNLVDVGSAVARTAPRVRTEVKVERTPQPQGDTSEVVDAQQGPAAKAQQHDDRIDIGVFHSDRMVATTLHGNGARDVVLETATADVAALIEVKVYPDSYVDHGRCRWLMDVEKLASLADCTRGVLLVDTSLPLSTIGVVVKKRNGAPLGRTAGSLPPWPMRDDVFRVQSFEFTPVVAPRVGGLYLWALAVQRVSPWTPAFNGPNRTMGVLNVAEVVACCWSITRIVTA